MFRPVALLFASFLGVFAAQASQAAFISAASPAEAGDPGIPDLVYHFDTGEVFLDSDGSSILAYVLQNGTGSFLPSNYTPFLGGVSSGSANQLEEASLSPFTGIESIGVVFPAGLDLLGLETLLTDFSVARDFGVPIVPLDLVVIGGGGDGPVVPEPSTYVMSGLALLGLGAVAWRKRNRRA